MTLFYLFVSQTIYSYINRLLRLNNKINYFTKSILLHEQIIFSLLTLPHTLHFIITYILEDTL
jgi:hypothetical protein